MNDVVSDANPTCGVTGIPIRGRNVTLSCIMTYRRKTGRVNPGAGFAASISWDSAAGTFVSNSSMDATNTAGDVVGETLKVDVVTVASGTDIPSYTCTSEFYFTDKPNMVYTYALNGVSGTCVSAPVTTWCTYFRAILSRPSD